MSVNIPRALLGLFIVSFLTEGAVAGISLAEVTPGTTTRSQMTELFGPPAEGVGETREVFEAGDRGFVHLAVHYDAADVIQRAEFVPVHDFTPAQVELLFDLRSKSPRLVDGIDLVGGRSPISAMGFTRHYDADGLAVYAVGNRVVTILLTGPEREQLIGLRPVDGGHARNPSR